LLSGYGLPVERGDCAEGGGGGEDRKKIGLPVVAKVVSAEIMPQVRDRRVVLTSTASRVKKSLSTITGG